MNDERNPLINPDDLPKRQSPKERKPSSVPLPAENGEDGSDGGLDVGKYHNRGGQLRINFESSGRFSTPKTLFLNDYTGDDISDISMCRPDDLLETLIEIVNGCVVNSEAKSQDMTLEEFFETLVGMKSQFSGTKHTHRWLDECQKGVPSEEQELSEVEIDLDTIKYKSIEEADIEFREKLKPVFEAMSDEDFNKYLIQKYGEATGVSREDELQTIQIKEPVILVSPKGHTYRFRFTRIGDLVDAYKLVQSIYGPKIRLAQRQKPKHGVKLADFKYEQEKEIKGLENELAKETVKATKALSLISKNGEELNLKQRIEEYKKLEGAVFEELLNFFNSIEFGIYDERELICNLCNEPRRRHLQRSFTPVELLPATDSSKSSTSNGLGLNSGSLIYFGNTA